MKQAVGRLTRRSTKSTVHPYTATPHLQPLQLWQEGASNVGRAEGRQLRRVVQAVVCRKLLRA